MEELLKLRTAIEQQRYNDALIYLGEMEEMSREDKIHKIRSYVIILLIHLIKQQTEQRTTRSWDCSIANSIDEIQYVNKRRKSGGYYLTKDELVEIIAQAYSPALRKAALEAFEGQYTTKQLEEKINSNTIQAEALNHILEIMQQEL
ncbi:DUF29 family protein [Candidatus Halobeggiatoa sp. HSG11]|nr:DUF29 family protein [Candidatus Halobeggiatoa sp. HSG11]